MTVATASMTGVLAVIAVVGSDGRWAPGIGDPTAAGWITVIAYLACAALCVAAARVRTDVPHWQRRGFWLATAAILLALGVNKQLDLQSWVTQVGSDLAHAQGWYEARKPAQIAFVAALAAGGALGVGLLLRAQRGAPGPVRLALAGVAVLVVFVTARAASFHHIDRFLDLHWSGVRMNAVLELGGIAIVGAGAGGFLRRLR